MHTWIFGPDYLRFYVHICKAHICAYICTHVNMHTYSYAHICSYAHTYSFHRADLCGCFSSWMEFFHESYYDIRCVKCIERQCQYYLRENSECMLVGSTIFVALLFVGSKNNPRALRVVRKQASTKLGPQHLTSNRKTFWRIIWLMITFLQEPMNYFIQKL